MKAKLFSSVALLCVAGSAFAAERAVEAVHYQLGLGAEYFNFNGKGAYANDDGNAVAANLGGEVTFPLGPYFGASAGARFGKYNSEDDDGRSEYEDDTIGGVVQVFYRNPSVGRISFGYEREQTDYTSTSNVYYPSEYSDSYTTYSYLARVEGYFGPVTLAVDDARGFYDYGFGVNGHRDFVHASMKWYVAPRVRVGLAAGFDDAKDTYIADVEFQPAFLGNAAGIYVGYMRSNPNEGDVNAVRIGIDVYFDKRFDLKTRDRHYR